MSAVEEVPELSDEATHPIQQTQTHIQIQAYISEDINEARMDDMNLPTVIQEEKSSSFPFDTLQSDLTALYDQSSVGGLNDTPANTTDSLDNLLANLAEENANSLPAEENEFTLGGESRDQTGGANSDNSSQPAIAEDLENGGGSLDTKNDVADAEMVSEDELPAPKVSKVDDAEEVSDEELPGPKLAELPADTEVVSEDELPATNKAKRKASGYDPESPTDETEIPDKKGKFDEEGGGKFPPKFHRRAVISHFPEINYSIWTFVFRQICCCR